MRFTFEFIRTFSTSTGRSYMSSAFSTKLSVVYCRAATSLKRWSTIYFFLKIFFLKQLVFGRYSKNSLWWVLFIAKLQSEHWRLVTLLKELHHRNSSNKFLNFCNELFFRNIFIYEEANYMKDYIKTRQRKARKGTTLRLFYAEYFLTSNIC